MGKRAQIVRKEQDAGGSCHHLAFCKTKGVHSGISFGQSFIFSLDTTEGSVRAIKTVYPQHEQKKKFNLKPDITISTRLAGHLRVPA